MLAPSLEFTYIVMFFWDSLVSVFEMFLVCFDLCSSILCTSVAYVCPTSLGVCARLGPVKGRKSMVDMEDAVDGVGDDEGEKECCKNILTLNEKVY